MHGQIMSLQVLHLASQISLESKWVLYSNESVCSLWRPMGTYTANLKTIVFIEQLYNDILIYDNNETLWANSNGK